MSESALHGFKSGLTKLLQPRGNELLRLAREPGVPRGCGTKVTETPTHRRHHACKRKIGEDLLFCHRYSESCPTPHGGTRIKPKWGITCSPGPNLGEKTEAVFERRRSAIEA